MAEVTSIAWCDSTFNPFIGCTRVSPGCDGCYAAVSTPARTLGVEWGAGKPRRRTSASNWAKPIAWNKKAAASGQPWRVFCASLGDVFDNEVPIAWLVDLLDLIRQTRRLTWLLLTKRIGNWRQRLEAAAAALRSAEESFEADEIAESVNVALREWIEAWLSGTHPPHVWIGNTVVNQEEADRDIPKLLAVPAAVRFLSIEPMLGPIDLGRWLWECCGNEQTGAEYMGTYERGCCGNPEPRDAIDWVIVGGESDQPGHRARPFNIEWARDIVRQCKAAGVPAFVKQMGSNVVCEEADATGHRAEYPDFALKPILACKDRAGADPSEWPADLRVREFP